MKKERVEQAKVKEKKKRGACGRMNDSIVRQERQHTTWI